MTDMNLQFKISANFTELKNEASQAKLALKSLFDTVKQVGQNVKIKVGLDISGINADIQNLKATVRKALQGSATEKVKVKIEADAHSIKSDIAALKPQIQSALASLGAAVHHIKVAIDIPTLQTSINAAKSSLSTTLAPLKITIDHATLAKHLLAAEKQVKAAIARMSTAASTVSVSVNVDASATGLITALNALKTEVIALKNAITKKISTGGGGSGGGLGGASSDVNGFASALRDAKTQLMQLVSAFGLLIGIKAFASITDEAKSLESKLKLVTSSQQELNQVTADLREIAKNNLQGLAPTVELYSKLSSGTKNLEGSNAALNTRLTDIVSKLVTISGSTGPAAEGAIIQFGQALSGNFSAAGQELNSIIEQAPALADAIAKSYGVTRGELKKLGSEGKITAEGVVNGLIRQGVEVDALFGKVNKTIGGTATTTGEALKLLIVDMDKAIGLSDAMISTLVAIRDNLSEIELVAKLVGAALLGAFSLAVVTQIGAISAAIGVGLTASLIGLVIQARIAGTSLLAAFGTRLLASITSVNIALASLKGVVASIALVFATLSIGEYLFNESVKVRLFAAAFMKTWEEIFTKLKGGFSVLGQWIEFSLKNPIDRIRIEIAKLITSIAIAIDAVNPFGSTIKNTLLELANFVMPKSKAFDEFNKQIAETRANTAKAVKDISDKYDAVAQMEIENDVAKNKTKIDDKSLNTVKTPKKPSSTDPFAIKKADLDAELQLLDARFNAEEIGMRKYYAEKARLIAAIHNNELANIDAKIKAENDATKKGDLLTKRKEAETAKTTALEINKIDLTKAIADAKKESLKISVELDDAKLQAVNNKFEAKEKEIVDKYKKQLDDFKKATLDGFGDTAEAAKLIAEKTDLVNSLINKEKARNNLERIQEEIKAFTETQEAALRKIDILKEKGIISDSQAKNLSENIKNTFRDGLKDFTKEIDKISEKVPELKKLLDELKEKLLNLAPEEKFFDTWNEFFDEINNKLAETGLSATTSGLSDFFMDIATHAKSGSEAIKDFARGFAQSMAKIAADALATMAVVSLLRAFGIDVGVSKQSLTPKLIPTKSQHTGGITGIDGQNRTANPAWFFAAPRYHVGGIAGLQPGEIPAILQKGEEVLTAKDPRHVANGGGQSRGVTIINEFSREAVLNHIASSEGNDVFFNMIAENPTRIRTLLGV